jgi:hypothetical protein
VLIPTRLSQSTPPRPRDGPIPRSGPLPQQAVPAAVVRAVGSSKRTRRILSERSFSMDDATVSPGSKMLMSFLSMELFAPQLVRVAQEVARARSRRAKEYPDLTAAGLNQHLARETRLVRKTIRIQDDDPCCWTELSEVLWFPLLDTVAEIDLMRDPETEELPSGIRIFPIVLRDTITGEEADDVDNEFYFSLLLELDTSWSPSSRDNGGGGEAGSSLHERRHARSMPEEEEERDEEDVTHRYLQRSPSSSARTIFTGPRYTMKSGLYLVSARTEIARQIIRLPEHSGRPGLMRMTSPSSSSSSSSSSAPSKRD